MNMKPRPAVQRFAQAMERKLRQNDDREGWEGCSYFYLLSMMEREVKEVRESLVDQDPKEAQLEAADVANFAMMIYDNLRRKK